MVKGIRCHGLDDGNVIHDGGQVRQQFRQFGTVTSNLRELEFWG
jgi:hypothetical protein